MASLDVEKAYKAEVRVTATRGFGETSLSDSFSRGNPEEVTPDITQTALPSNYPTNVRLK